MGDKQDPAVARLHENLQTIRKVAGWSAEELGNKLGVSKQSIRNLETGKNKLSKTQYIAIRAVLDYKVASNDPESDALQRVITAILDTEDEDTDETYDSDEDATAIIPMTKGTDETDQSNSRKKSSKSRAKVAAVAAAGVAVAGMAPWLIKMLKDPAKK